MIKQILENNDKVSANCREVEALKKALPSYFDKDGNFDITKLKNLLDKNEVDISKEGFELKFLGKNYAKYLAGVETETVITPDVEHNEKEENINSENVYLRGDNLDALSHLLKAYSEKVKMIYIDPPYNTGSDGFVYNDKFEFTPENLAKAMGIEQEEAERLISLKGRSSHSAWLTFMYPRLTLARELLREDGVIFISIDDNEVAQLKLLCDDVFGEENFVGDIIWNSTKSVTNTALISVSHTHNLVYFKCNEYFVKNRSEFRLKDDGEGFENPDNDPRGAWKADPFQVGGWRPNQQYEIINPNTNVVYKPNTDCSWKNDYDKYLELLKDNRIVFGKDGKSGPQRKRFIWEAQERGKVSKTLWTDIDTTTNGTQMLKTLFNNDNIFNNPKPIGLIKRMCELAANSHNDIILDFFSGSATTAHAVMQLNAEDGGKRKFILVQLDEEIDPKKSKTAYDFCINEIKQQPVISSIGIERIKRSVKEIKNSKHKPFDSGFKIYKLNEFKDKALNSIIDFNPEIDNISNSINDFKFDGVDGIKTVLTTYMIKDGFDFNTQYEKIMINNYEAYKCENVLYLLNEGFDCKGINELVKRLENNIIEINKIVVFSYTFNFSNSIELKANIKQLKNVKPPVVEVRY